MSRTTRIVSTLALLAAVSQASGQTYYAPPAQQPYPTAVAQAPANVNWQSYVQAPSAACGCDSSGVGYQIAPPACSSPAYTNYAPCDTTPAYAPCYTAPACPSSVRWMASVGALFLTREPQDSYTFSYDSANEANQYVDAADADMNFAPGVEATIGRYDCCANVGWQLTYWQLFPGSESTQQLGSDLSPGFLDGIRNYDQLDYSGGGAGDGAGADDNVNAAQIHRLTRDWDVYNVEANAVFLLSPSQCGAWNFQSLTGFRYFKFRESLLFVSDPSETMIDGDADEYNINIRTDNQLYGFQLGGVTERCLTPRWSMRLLAKAGVYANHASMNYFEGGSAGAATINNGPNAGQMMRVNTSTNDLSFLGEFGAGVTYRLNCAWRLGADYRVIGATGLALPTDQIYFDTRGINDVRVLDNDGSLLLHGAFVRVERCF